MSLKRRFIAKSSSSGRFVAPSRITSPLHLNPFDSAMNVFFILEAESLSPSPLYLTNESISSMKIMDGAFSFAN